MKRFRTTAALAATLLAAASLPASAEEIMTLRMAADRTAVSTAELQNGDAVLQGELFIENYTGITFMKLQLKSDAPLSLENGDFTRDPNQTEMEGGVLKNKPAFFVDHGATEYMQHSDITGAENVVMWYALYAEDGEVGEIDNADSSFLNFDIRIPQNTPAGDYTVYLSEENITNSVGQIEPDFSMLRGWDDLIPGKDVLLQPVTVSVYTRGDFNCDGSIGSEDAQGVLRYCLESLIVHHTLTDAEFEALSGTPHRNAAIAAADVSETGSIEIADAQMILRYYLANLIGSGQTWEDLS